jgi:adenine-specific DNA-methyltransferase
VYIDPPYNTGNDGFDYKDNYQHSTWLAMLVPRLIAIQSLASTEGVLFCSIDDNECPNIQLAGSGLFGTSALEALVVIQSNKRGQTYQSIAKTHEYLAVFLLGETASIGEWTREIEEAAGRDSIGPYELWELRNRNPKFGRHNRPNLYYPIYVAPTLVTNEGLAPVSLAKTETYTVEVLPVDSSGRDSCWRWGQDKVRESVVDANTNVLVGKAKRDGSWGIYQKSRKSTTKAKTIWTDTDVINEQGTVLIGHLGLDGFVFPKPLALLAKVIEIGGAEEAVILDFFAGSGTTGHAVINLNREDGGRRQFILVEMADYFDTVLLPRLKKVAFTPEWKDGKPKRLPTPEEIERGPRLFKIVRLESYEDTLNNLEVKRTAAQQSLLDLPKAQGPDRLREQYLLQYLLKVETQGSPSLLNIAAFSDPTAYRLKVKRPGSDESREVCVDLIETFNWLLGLTVTHIAAPQMFRAKFERDAEKRLKAKIKHERPKGEIEKKVKNGSVSDFRVSGFRDESFWFRTVEGTMPDGRKALVIWRKLTGNPEEDNLVLDEWFTKQGYSSKDSEFDLIYVNGGNNLENLKTPDDTWKVRLIEEDFHRLMFAGEGV